MKAVNKLKIKKLVCIGLMTFGMIITLAGCALPSTLRDGLNDAFNDRAEQNKNIADQLYNSGLLRKDTYEQIVKNIENKLSNVANSMGESDEDMQNLLKACVGWRIPVEPDHIEYSEDGKVWWYVHGTGHTPCTDIDSPVKNVCTEGHKGIQCADFYNQFVTSFLVANESLSRVVKNNVPCVIGTGAKIKPIEVISESLVEQINEQLSVPIYVLKTDVGSNGRVGLDTIVNDIQSASNMKGKAEAEQILSQYFEAATYVDKKDGKTKALTVMDPTDPKQQVVRITTSSYNDTSDPTVFSGTPISKEYTYYNGMANFPDQSQGNKPGLDITVSMSGEPVLAVRLIEFNQEAISTLINKVGLNENRYLVVNGRAYLMEYPIGYIEGFTENESRTGFKSIIKQSQLGFNLITGKFSKFELNDDNSVSNNSVTIADDDPYLTYNGVENRQDETQASLVLYGETGVTKEGAEVDPCNEPWNLRFGGTDTNPYLVSIGRIVLRDYLEASYAPEVQGSETLIVLGRKLRILQLEGNKDAPMAGFYDKEGKPLEGASNLYIDDFADIQGVLESPAKVNYISRNQEAIASETTGQSDTSSVQEESRDTEQAEDEDTGSEELEQSSDSSTSEDEFQQTLTKIDRLPTSIVTEIKCTTKFPGEYIGASDQYDTAFSSTESTDSTDDKKEDSEKDKKGMTGGTAKPLFYAMLVKKNIFETGLFSGWIQTDDQEKNSLVWWNNWLDSHGFKYRINGNALVDFLKGNYAYELNKSGIIILDLETISKIQQEYTQDQKIETGHKIRTMFIILGYILIAYAFILLVAWNVDVNVDLGLNLLQKFSFGHWVAVKSHEETPYFNTEEIAFINFGELLLKCLIIITIGIALIMINIIDLLLMLISLFGDIAKYMTRVITGI